MIRANFNTLDAAAAAVASASVRLQQHKDDMDQYLMTLRGIWAGVAGVNWNTTQGTWNNAHDEVTAILTSLAGALGIALDNYANTERVNAQRFPL